MSHFTWHSDLVVTVVPGEPLPMELCNRLQSHHRQLRNHYGQTEVPLMHLGLVMSGLSLQMNHDESPCSLK